MDSQLIERLWAEFRSSCSNCSFDVASPGQFACNNLDNRGNAQLTFSTRRCNMFSCPFSGNINKRALNIKQLEAEKKERKRIETVIREAREKPDHNQTNVIDLADFKGRMYY